MADPLVLSVLDQSPVSEGSSGADALHNTLDLARLADELGYHRYWLAEHHGGTMLAGPSPEVLIGPVATATSRIRVGSGGVMLPHYSPLKVAESFSILAGLFPERIDLAIGRAPGTDPLTTFALQRDRRQAAPDDFPTQLAELLGLLENRLPARPPLPATRRPSRTPARARALAAGLLAAERDLGRRAGPALRLRRLHQPHRRADRRAVPRPSSSRPAAPPAPRVAIGVWAICAETDEEAQRLAASARMAMRCCAAGARSPSRRPTRRVRFLESEGQALDATPPGRRTVVGSPADGGRGLREVAESYGADEVVVVSITHEHEARRRSYELIAEAFDLAGAAARRSSVAS